MRWWFFAGVVLAASVTRGDAACPFDEGDPGSIHAFAERLLVHRDPAVAAANRNRIFIALDRLEKLAVRGDFTNRVRYAEARETVGVLYGQTRFLTLARWTRERLRREFGDLPDLRYGTSDPAVLAHRKLLALNRAALATEQVEPGDATHPFWNVHARFFTYAPAFDFRPVPSAAAYRFRVYDRNQEVHEFTAETPFASLLPVWDAVPAGPTRVICYAVDAQGGILGIAGERDFRRLEPFYPNGYAPARRTYAEALARVNGFLRDWPELKEILATGKADLSHQTNIVNYPSKMLPWAIRMLIARGEIKEAKTVAEYLLSLREPAGAPLEHFTPTYVGDYFICRRYRGQTMMLYPAEGAGGFLDLYDACGEPRYLEAAEQTARTYLKLQRPDGTWSLKYELATGRVTSPNALMPNKVIDFLERLYGLTGKEEYRAAADRAFAFIERGPLADWNWEGQFEDIRPAESKYANLTKHYACDTAIYLLKRFPGDAKRLDQARRLLRFAEDQFVVWVRPCDGDGQGFGHLAYYPYNTWRCPVALEQYSCYQPIDASAAKLIRTYLALHAAEGNPLDLAKARALGDSMVNNQDDNGRIRTYWIPEAGDRDDPDAGAVRLPEGGDWFNCMCASAEALALLKEDGVPAPGTSPSAGR